MKSTCLLSAVAALGLLSSGATVNAQAITWAASGLPPGLSIQTVNTTNGTARIVGTPTTAGNYNVSLYPMVNGVAGDFLSTSFSVLPAGDTTPKYYSYSRAVDGGQFSPLVGGGGRVYGSSGGIYMTTNGRLFSKATLPASVAEVPFDQGASVGSRVLLLSDMADTMLVNSNGGAFTNFAFPSGSTNYSGPGGFGLTSDGSSSFYLVKDSVSPGISYTRTVTVWSAGSGWTQRAVFTNSLDPSAGFPSNVRAAFAKSTNNVSLLTVYSEQSAIASILLRSTNNGVNWTKVASFPAGISGVAFGNGNFLALADGGVFRSPGTNGTNWTKVSSSSQRGDLRFTNNVFLSSLGASKDGNIWVGYDGGIPGPFGGSAPVVLGGSTNLIFAGGGQLSTVYVPSGQWVPGQRANIGTSVNIPLSTW